MFWLVLTIFCFAFAGFIMVVYSDVHLYFDLQRRLKKEREKNE